MNLRDVQRTFGAELAQLPAMMHWVRERAQEGGFTGKEGRRIELALEEALVNIIEHAYPIERGEIEISCSLHPGSSLSFTLVDQGVAFNPLNHIVPANPEIPLEQRKEGGLGTLLMRQYMDEVHYERRHASNVLILSKKITPSCR